jgi:hypothetical protein
MLLGLATVAILIAGCGGGATSQPTRTGFERCLSDQLSVRQGRLGAAAGSSGTSLIFKNVSRSPCSLEGYPSLQTFNAAGKPVPTFARDGAPFTTIPPGLRVRIVKLAPGATASVYVGLPDSFGAGSATCPETARLRIIPPGDRAPIMIPWRLDPPGATGRPGRERLQCGQITISPVATPIKGWA